MISLIWAMDENRGIGYQNQLPWHLPEDLKFFKRMTIGKPIAMGRKTFESIGKPLPGRENIIITRQELMVEGCTVIHDVNELQTRQEPEVMVIGGAEIFKETLAMADRLYITKIHASFPADTYFPEFDEAEWEEREKVKGIKDEKNKYDYEFFVFDRKK